MKKNFSKAFAAISVIIIVVVALSSCSGEMVNIERQQQTIPQQSSFCLDITTNQGRYQGYAGTFRLSSTGYRIDSLVLQCSWAPGYRMETFYDYSHSGSVTITQHDNGSLPISYQTDVELDADGLPSSCTTTDLIQGRTDQKCHMEFSFRLNGDLYQILLKQGHRETFLNFEYEEKENWVEPLRWASYYPDVLNAWAGSKGVGEMIATIASHRSSKRVKQINCVSYCQDERYMSEILILRDSDESIRIESRAISSGYTYGTIEEWIDKNLDAMQLVHMIN